MKDSMKTRKACLSLATLAGVSALVAAPMTASAAIATWDYGANPNLTWANNTNWSNNTAGVVTNDDVVFNATGSGTTTVMNKSSPFVINSLRLTTGATYNHTIDLNATQLSVTQTTTTPGLYVATGTNQIVTLNLTNGTFAMTGGQFDVGAAATTGPQGTLNGSSSLAFTSSQITRMHVGTGGGNGTGTVNFTTVSSGVLSVAGGLNTVLVGAGSSSSSGTGATGTVTLGNNWTSTTIGSNSVRGDLKIGSRTSNRAMTGTFTQSAGTFTADLLDWHVGSTGGQDVTTVNGALNLTGVTGLDIDVTNLRVGTSTANATGTVTLPTGNVIVNTSALIGGGTKGTLNLNRTDFAVGSAAILTLGTTGEINSTIGSVSAGIDIANTAVGALVISNTAQVSNTRGVEITFEANPVGVDWKASATGADGIFYGFKWAGNKISTLNGIRDGTDNILGNTDDTLVWNQTGLSGQFLNKATLFYDGTGPGTLGTNATYIGFYTVIPEPASLSLLAIGGLGLMRRRRRAD